MAAKKKKARNKPYVTRYDKDRRLEACVKRLAVASDANLAIDPRQATFTIEKAKGALQQVINGVGTLDDVSYLAAQHGLALVLCKADFSGSGQHLDIVNNAGMALKAAGEMHLRLRKWGFDDHGIQAMRDLIDLRVAQLFHEENTIGIERQALEKAMADVRSGNCLRFVFHPDAVSEGVARA